MSTIDPLPSRPFKLVTSYEPRGDQPRAILICDVWNPRLPPAEREVVASLMAALDRFNGGGPGGDTGSGGL